MKFYKNDIVTPTNETLYTLTIGKFYIVLNATRNTVVLKNDRGNTCSFANRNFVKLKSPDCYAYSPEIGDEVVSMVTNLVLVHPVYKGKVYIVKTVYTDSIAVYEKGGNPTQHVWLQKYNFAPIVKEEEQKQVATTEEQLSFLQEKLSSCEKQVESIKTSIEELKKPKFNDVSYGQVYDLNIELLNGESRVVVLPVSYDRYALGGQFGGLGLIDNEFVFTKESLLLWLNRVATKLVGTLELKEKK